MQIKYISTLDKRMEKLYMPKNMTVYDLLISCPSDVNKYVQVIEKIISDFNSMYGEINNSLIVAKHWKKIVTPNLEENHKIC